MDEYLKYIIELIKKQMIKYHLKTFNVKYLEKAIKLNEDMIEIFWDTEHNGFFMYGNDGERLILRPKEIYDGAMPSGNSVATYNMLRLSSIIGNVKL